MIIKFKFLGLNHSINADGDFKITNSYVISSDANTEENAYQDAVNWSGSIGDYFRYPDLDNSSYHFDDTIKVSEINIKNLVNNFTFQVDFIYENHNNSDSSNPTPGEPSESFDPENPETLILISQSLEVALDKDNIKTIEANYEYYGDSSQFTLTKIGDTIEIDENLYICREYTIKKIEQYRFKLTIKGVQANINFKLIEENANADEFEKTVKYFVEYNNIDSFLEDLKINSSSSLVGADYVLKLIKDIDYNDFGVYVSLKFREVVTRMLSYTREEHLASFINGSMPEPNIIHKSIWQVKASDLANFQNLTGSYANWASEENLITKVIPKYISEVEYEVTLEAQNVTNPDLYKTYRTETYYSLANRKDYKIKSTSMRLAPKDCGYILHEDGLYREINNWNPYIHCPITTTTILSESLINSCLTLLEISESCYYRGGIDNQIDRAALWIQGKSFNGRIGCYEGSFLKHKIYSSEVYDNLGRKWTRFTYVYHLAPTGKTWNGSYWWNKS